MFVNFRSSRPVPAAGVRRLRLSVPGLILTRSLSPGLTLGLSVPISEVSWFGAVAKSLPLTGGKVLAGLSPRITRLMGRISSRGVRAISLLFLALSLLGLAGCSGPQPPAIGAPGQVSLVFFYTEG